MSLTVVKTDLDETNGTVTIESDLGGQGGDFRPAINELRGGEAKVLAIKAAQMGGLPDPRLGMGGDTYAVDAKGEVIQAISSSSVHRYRIDLPVTRRLV